jgi:hypothetical protein
MTLSSHQHVPPPTRGPNEIRDRCTASGEATVKDHADPVHLSPVETVKPAEVLYSERTGFRGRSGRRIDSSMGDPWRLADRAVFGIVLIARRPRGRLKEISMKRSVPLIAFIVLVVTVQPSMAPAGTETTCENLASPRTRLASDESKCRKLRVPLGPDRCPGQQGDVAHLVEHLLCKQPGLCAVRIGVSAGRGLAD